MIKVEVRVPRAKNSGPCWAGGTLAISVLVAALKLNFRVQMISISPENVFYKLCDGTSDALQPHFIAVQVNCPRESPQQLARELEPEVTLLELLERHRFTPPTDSIPRCSRRMDHTMTASNPSAGRVFLTISLDKCPYYFQEVGNSTKPHRSGKSWQSIFSLEQRNSLFDPGKRGALRGRCSWLPDVFTWCSNYSTSMKVLAPVYVCCIEASLGVAACHSARTAYGLACLAALLCASHAAA